MSELDAMGHHAMVLYFRRRDTGMRLFQFALSNYLCHCCRYSKAVRVFGSNIQQLSSEVFFSIYLTDGASEILDRVLAADPNHISNLRWRGDLYRYLSDDSSAEKVYNTALDAHKASGGSYALATRCRVVQVDVSSISILLNPLPLVFLLELENCTSPYSMDWQKPLLGRDGYRKLFDITKELSRFVSCSACLRTCMPAVFAVFSDVKA